MRTVTSPVTLTLLVAAVAALVLSAPAAGATSAPDPYVDAVAPANEVPVTDPAGLTGPPDGRFATVSGRFAKFLVLDLGAGEEGVGDLEVRYHNPPGTIAQAMDVHFLDGNGQDLGQGRLTMIGSGTHVTTVTNPSTRPYRYLRILTGLQTARFDSMRAAALAARTTQASPATADPYIDALAPDNEIQVDVAADLFGAPDGRYATVYGRQFSFLVLDLGAGEEGVGDLEVHYALRPGEDFGFYLTVHFLDRNGRRLGQAQLGMVGWDGAPRVTTVKAPTTKPYRYLKIHTDARTVTFDSMRAAALAP